MQTCTGYYRVPWWLLLGGPFLVIACEWLAWAIIHPDMLAEMDGRRSGFIKAAADILSPPFLALAFAALGLAFAWALVMLTVASIQHKPSFRLDAMGVTSFPLYSRQPRFIAWGEIEGVQVLKNAVSLTGGRGPNGSPRRVGIALMKQNNSDFMAALARYRPDLAGRF